MSDVKTCPVCKRMVQEDAKWCSNCGTNLSEAETGRAPPQGPPQSYQRGSSDPTTAKGRITEAIRWRMQSDEVISEIWLVLPLIGVIGGVFLGTLFFFIGGPLVTLIAIVIASILFVVFFAILNYKLFNRNNQHMRREAMLRDGIIDYFRNKGSEKGVSEKISVNISTMESINYEARINDEEHNAALWAILPTLFGIVPVVGWIFLLIALYYLTKFPTDHDRRWHAFTQQVQNAGSHMGAKVILPSWKTLPDRSYVLYLVLTILTSGLFGLYWYYVLIKDMNMHFKTQWKFEDQLIQELE